VRLNTRFKRLRNVQYAGEKSLGRRSLISGTNSKSINLKSIIQITFEALKNSYLAQLDVTKDWLLLKAEAERHGA
jgi:hypothetical protein